MPTDQGYKEPSSMLELEAEGLSTLAQSTAVSSRHPCLRFRSTPALDLGPCIELLQGAKCHAGTAWSFVVISHSINVCGTVADAAGVAFQADGV